MENKFTPITIKFVKEEAKDKDSKGNIVVSKNPKGEVNFLRNDLVGLAALLRRFDTRIHPPKDWKQSIKIKEKLTEAYIKDAEGIELTLDQATFLKLYLKDLPEKEGKQEALPEFELRTLFGTLDQFDNKEEER